MVRSLLGGVCLLTAALTITWWGPARAAQETPVKNLSDSRFDGKNRVFVSEVRVKLKREIELASERPGLVATVLFRQGQKVERGKLVVQLKDDMVRRRYEAAQLKATNDIEVRFAEAARKVADAEYDAALDANRRLPGTIAETEIRRLRLDAEKSVLQIEQAEHQFNISKLEAAESLAELESYRIVSPISGRVSRVLREPGEAVAQGDAILEIVNTERFIVEGYVMIDHVALVHRGCQVTVTYDGKDYTGFLTDVDREASYVGGRVKVFAEIGSGVVSSADEAGDKPLLAGVVARMIIRTDRDIAIPEEKQTLPTAATDD